MNRFRLLQAMAVLATLMPAWSAAGERTVVPGGVLRWSAPGTESCTLGERTWAPLGDTCFFPVDLLATGRVTVGRSRAGKVETATVRVGPYPYPEQRLKVPERMVDLSPANLARVERENARIAALWPRETSTRFSLPLRPPLPSPYQPERFGNRRVFNDQPRSPHNGVDYKAPAGMPVKAVADGVVVLAEAHFFAGNSVFVDHGNGLISMVFHLARIDVRAGQIVRAGETLGTVGATGRATGPHLHFGVRWHGARIDPTLLLAPPEQLPALDP